MEQAVLDREEFRQWLLRAGEQVVGRTCSGRACPLASWLHEVVGGPVFVGGLGVNFGSWSFLAPEWAQQFATAIDESAVEKGKPVTGLEAVALLDSLP